MAPLHAIFDSVYSCTLIACSEQKTSYVQRREINLQLFSILIEKAATFDFTVVALNEMEFSLRCRNILI